MMKTPSLFTLIPLSAAGLITTVGCGGKAINVEGDGDGERPGQRPQGGDPLSDENFPESLDQAIDDYCEEAAPCDFGSTSECTREVSFAFTTVFDTDSRTCRSLTLNALECFTENWSDCEATEPECLNIAQDLSEECLSYDEYDYYDY